jgi:hypothetical protein
MSDQTQFEHYGNSNINIKVQDVDWANAQELAISKAERAKRHGRNTRIHGFLGNENIETLFDVLRLVQRKPNKLCNPLVFPGAVYEISKDGDIPNCGGMSINIIKAKLSEFGFWLGSVNEEILNQIADKGFEEVTGVDPDAEPTWEKQEILQSSNAQEAKDLDVDYSKRWFAVDDFKIVSCKEFNCHQTLEVQISLPLPLSNHIRKGDFLGENNPEENQFFQDKLQADKLLHYVNVKRLAVIYRGEGALERFANIAIASDFAMSANLALSSIQNRARERVRTDFQKEFSCKL